MDTSGWERAKELFHEAVKLPPAARDELLAGVTAEVRQEVGALLAAHEEAGSAQTTGSVEGEGPGTVIDRYKILQEIGEGGFGVVYMAEQTEPVTRKVALKIIKLGMDTKQVVARFEAERQALALMDHPNIAKVLDGGTTKHGRPYFVMELVKGIPITEYCDKAGLTTVERLDLFTSVCHAVQHAHQKGIIHRDLKPSNVLVTLHEGRPVPKVIDFGIAKATDRRLTEKTLFTEYRQIIGTPEYMAPEQAEMTSLDVDTRADIYSLGVLLYELLTGTKPFDMKSLLEQGYGEVLRTIREVDPPRPSTRLSTLGDELPTIAKLRHTQPKMLGKMIRGDLDWIVMKALEKDRSRRYATATALADDIGRSLLDQPVLAGPPTRTYRLRKYLKRHRVGVAAAATILVALIGGLWVSIAAMNEARHQTDLARVAETDATTQRDAATIARADEAEQRLRAEKGEAESKREALRASTALGLVTRALSSADPHETKSPNYTVRELLDDIANGIGDTLEDQPDIEATVRSTIGTAYIGLGLPAKAASHLQRALALRREHLGEDAPETLESLVAWCTLLHDRGDYGKSAEVARDALKRYERVLGPDAVDTQGVKLILAERLYHIPRLKESERLLREVLASTREQFGTDNGRYVQALTELARIVAVTARFDEAHELLVKAQEIAERMPIPEVSSLLRIRQELVAVLRSQGRLKEAEQIAQERLAYCKEVLGERHASTAAAQFQLATAQRLLGKLGEARTTYESAITLAREISPDYLQLGEHLAEYAAVEQLVGDSAKAEDLVREALDITKERYGERHKVYGTVLGSYGVMLSHMGRLAEAEEALQRSLAIIAGHVGKRNDGYAVALANLATMLQQRGAHDEAAKGLREALELRTKIYGAESPQVAIAAGNLARSLTEMGDLDEALALSLRSVDLFRRFAPEHSHLGIGLSNLGDLYRRMARYEDAEKALLEGLELMRTRLGAQHPQCAMPLGNLGTVYSESGRLKEGERYLEEADALMREGWGVDHTHRIWGLVNLASVEALRLDHVSAVTHLREALRIVALRPGWQPVAVARAHAELGELLWQQGQFADAERHLHVALDMQVTVHGERSGEVIETRVRLANLFRARGEVVKAVELLEKTLGLIDESAMHGQLRAGSVYNILALAEVSRGRHDAAVRHAEEAVRRMQTHVPGTWNDLAARGNCAFVLMTVGRFEEAADRFAATVDLARRLEGVADVRLAGWCYQLAGCLTALERFEDALAPARESLAVFRKRLPRTHPNLSSVLATLGIALVETRKHAEAEPLLRESLQLRQQSMPRHYLTWNTMSVLGEALAGQGKYEDAESPLIHGFENLQAPDSPVWKARKAKALQRIVDLYEAWGKADEAAKWREAGGASAEGQAPAEPAPVGTDQETSR